MPAYCFNNDSTLQHANMVPMAETVGAHAQKTARILGVIWGTDAATVKMVGTEKTAAKVG